MTESNCVTHFACDCITRKLIKYDQLEKENTELKPLFSVQLDMLEQNKQMIAEIEQIKSKLKVAMDVVEEIAYQGSSRERCTTICEQALKEIES